MSGGLNYKQLVPDALTFIPSILEKIVKPINYHFLPTPYYSFKKKINYNNFSKN